MRWIGKALVGAVLIAAIAAAVRAALPGRAQEVARGRGAVYRLEVGEAGLVWLEGPGERRPASASSERRILFLARGGKAPAVLAAAPGVAGFSLQGDAVYYVAGPSLGRVALPGGAPAVLRAGLQHPTAVLALKDWICWTETRPPQGFSLPVLPLTRAWTSLRAMPREGGAIRTLAVTDGDADGVTLRLLGEMDGFLYWLEQRSLGRAATLIKRAHLAGAAAEGGAETVMSEEGRAEGVLAGGALYWTGASREGAPAGAFASVNRWSPEGRVELLADWLWSDGALRADGEHVYYCHSGVHALPGDAGVARPIVTLGDGGRLTQIFHGNAYAVESDGGPTYRIVRRPLDWTGRWAARQGSVP